MFRIKYFICFVALLVSVAMGKGIPKKDSLVVSAKNGVESSVGVWWGMPSRLGATSQLGTARPVAVWFHGGMTSVNCQKGLMAGNDLSELLPDYIVLSVSACKENHWVTPVAVEWVDAALDSIASRRNSPVESVYLLGVSDGALGTIVYSAEGKRTVAARTLVSSFGVALGDAERLAKSPRFHTGKWLFLQGGSDRLYPFEKTIPWIQTFCKKVRAECDLKYDPQGEHDWSYWKKIHRDWVLKLFLGK